jgi:hypothetical protein
MARISTWILTSIFSVCLILSSKAQSPDIVDIGPAAGDGRAYFLKSTFKQISPTVRSARIILNYKKERFGLDKDFKDDPKQRHLSYGSTYYANCSAKTIAQSGNALYSDAMGAGAVVKAFANDIPPPKFYQSLDLFS